MPTILLALDNLLRRGSRSRRCAWLFVVAALAVSLGAAARVQGQTTPPPDQAGPYKVGRTTFTFTDSTRNNRSLQTDVWYPIDQSTSTPTHSVYAIGVDEPLIPGVTITSTMAYSSGAVAAGTSWPLIVYSHGDSTWRYISWFVCEQLASHGFIVAACDHTGDTAVDFVNGTQDPDSKILQDRPLDISAVITKMLARSATNGDLFRNKVSSTKIGVMGWSYGGFGTLATATGYGTAPKDSRVKAILTMCAPTYTITTQQIASTNLPTMVLSGSADVLQYYSDAIFLNVNTTKTYLVRIQQAWHDSFNDLCYIYRYLVAQGYPASFIGQLFYVPNDTCPPQLIDADEVHRIANLYAVSFFKVNIASDSRYSTYLTRTYATSSLPTEVEFWDGAVNDLNGNGITDSTDIANGTSPDTNHNGIPDEAETGLLYVNAAATGKNNGTSWQDAYKELWQALQTARGRPSNPYIEIWVAKGTYRPKRLSTTGAPDRTASFRFVPDVALLGGFAGTETWSSQRDWVKNVTILSGDQLGDDGPGFTNTGDNCYSVFTGNAFSSWGIVDGFTISGGRADGNVVFWGGGGTSALMGHLPNFYHCTFTNNQAIEGGGALTAVGAQANFVDCVFHHNKTFVSALRNGGGGAFAADNASYPTLVNCTFADNSSETHGGAVLSEYGSTVTMQNCIAWGNASPTNDQLRVENYTGTEPPASLTVSNSDVQDGLPGASVASLGTLTWDPSNISSDPRFASTASYPYMLQLSSPCIDAGSNALVPSGETLDALNNSRIVDGNANGVAVVDIGAVEAPAVTCPGDLNGDRAVNTTDLSLVLAHFGQTVPGFTLGDADGDGFVGSTDLGAVLAHFGSTCAP